MPLMTDRLPPLPQPDELTRFFWESCHQKRLSIQRCVECRRYIHTPRYLCRYCWSTRLEPSPVSGRGHLAAFTVPHQPFDPYFVELGPYVLAVVELVEQRALRLVTNVVECEPDRVVMGMPLEVTFREITDEITLPLFRPIRVGA